MQMNTPPPREVEEWWAAYRAELFDTAVRVGKQLDGCNIETLRLFVADYDVVCAVIVDLDEPDGFTWTSIKGDDAMREIIATGEARALATTALPCRSFEEAQALRLSIGETVPLH